MEDARLPGYGSAMDLPSFVELMESLRGAKALTLIFARDKRQEFLELERKIKRMAATVDRFYDRLGDRHWIFHNLDMEKMATLTAANMSSEEMEARFIEEAYEEDALQLHIRTLTRFREMQPRMDLIRKAQTDYQHGRYYAVVLVLIAVMDGFVNDLDPASRRGLHNREAAEMAAWDNVVGHHKGLAAAHRTFTKSFKARIDEPVYELYRNGIVHGNITNFDNRIVAAKAWNRLFAVADWADARRKQSVPKKPERTWRELGRDLLENARVKSLLENWQPRVVSADSPNFADHPVHQAAREFLTAWQNKRYGLMIKVLPLEMHQAYGKQLPREVRSLYQAYELQTFDITTLDFHAPSVCTVGVSLRVNGIDHDAHMRWMHQTESSSDPVIEPDEGIWRLMLWGPDTFLDNNSPRTD